MIIEEFTIENIVLTKWVPPLITVLLGGLLASVIFPRWQDNYMRLRVREDRKLVLAEEVSRNLTTYLLCWNRLRTIAELETSREDGLTRVEFDRKLEFVNNRNDARDQLSDAMSSAEIYFSDDTRKAIYDFCSWDEQCSALTLAQLPSKSEFNKRKGVLLKAIHREIKK